MLARELLDALLHRDDRAIARIVETSVEKDGFDAALSQVRQFAILAFAPDESARAALLSIAALGEIQHGLPAEVRKSQLVELARLSADARRPWSEAPITTPPRAQAEDGSSTSLERAVRSRDRLAAERWLAYNIPSPDFERRFLAHALRMDDESLTPLRIAVCALRLTRSVPDPHRFAVLRTATVEWTAGYEYSHGPEVTAEPEVLAQHRIDDYIGEHASPLSFLQIEALDALQTKRDLEVRTPRGALATHATITGVTETACDLPALRHSPGRDYGSALRAFAIACRRRDSWPAAALSAMMRAAASTPAEIDSLTEDAF